MTGNISFASTLSFIYYNKSCTETHNYSHYGLTVFVVEVAQLMISAIIFSLLNRLLSLNGVDKKNIFFIKP